MYLTRKVFCIPSQRVFFYWRRLSTFPIPSLFQCHEWTRCSCQFLDLPCSTSSVDADTVVQPDPSPLSAIHLSTSGIFGNPLMMVPMALLPLPSCPFPHSTLCLTLTHQPVFLLLPTVLQLLLPQLGSKKIAHNILLILHHRLLTHYSLTFLRPFLVLFLLNWVWILSSFFIFVVLSTLAFTIMGGSS